MADNKSKWIEASIEVLSKLDLVAEYRALGLDVTGSKPSSKGWVEARSYGNEDRTPSAGICVAPGGLLGRYKDFRTGETLGFFDFAVKAGRFPTWRAARAHFANQTGVALPSGEDEFVADRFIFSDLTPGAMVLYKQGKPGVSYQSIIDVGGRAAKWPRKLSAEKTNHLISFPMYGEQLLEADPVGWHSFASNPRLKIRKFKGEGNPDELLDKMTAGEYGLMNVDGLRRLADADVINITEGISDLLACQAVLGDWREPDPDNRKHVCLSAGGCSYHPKIEWMHHFAGKEVRLWFDVGDGKNEGQVGAAVWVKMLLPVATKVRNCILPLGPEGGKNDLRAWLVAGHNYADMCEYAESFEPSEPTDDAAQMTPSDAILANIGITVIGEHEGSHRVEVFSEATRKIATIQDIDKLSISKLIQLVGEDTVEKYIHDGRECPPDKYDIKRVRNAIAGAASKKTFFGDEKYGAGVWEHDGQIVLVKAQEIGILNNVGRIEQSHVPSANGRILDTGRNSGDWYDLGSLNRYLHEAADHQWCFQTIEEARKLFDQWNWRQREQAPLMLVGLVVCSWLQSIWKFRPQVFVTGNSNTGKTILLQETIANGIFGRGQFGMFVEKPTEAAISQFMRHHSKVIIVDEFEKDAHRQKVLELFRTTSRGGVKIRGTADHKGVSFRLRHIPWLSAIETGLSREADKNRYIILELDTITQEKRDGFKPPSQSHLQDLGARLLAIGLKHYPEARRLAEVIKEHPFRDVPSRCIEGFALPCAMLFAALGASDEKTVEFTGGILGGWDFTFQAVHDHVDCLTTVLTQKVRLPRGEERTVSALVQKPTDPEYKNAMYGVGVRVVKPKFVSIDSECTPFLWLCPDVLGRTVLKGTKYEGHSIDQYLMRFPGSQRSRQRMGGDERFHGVGLPMESIRTLFDSDREDDETDGF